MKPQLDRTPAFPRCPSPARLQRPVEALLATEGTKACLGLSVPRPWSCSPSSPECRSAQAKMSDTTLVRCDPHSSHHHISNKHPRDLKHLGSAWLRDLVVRRHSVLHKPLGYLQALTLIWSLPGTVVWKTTVLCMTPFGHLAVSLWARSASAKFRVRMGAANAWSVARPAATSNLGHSHLRTNAMTTVSPVKRFRWSRLRTRQPTSPP